MNKTTKPPISHFSQIKDITLLHITMQSILQHLQENTETEIEQYISYDHDDCVGCDNFEPHYQNHDENSSKCTPIVSAILNGLTRLNVMPTTTILAFTVFAPFLTGDGQCTAWGQWLTGGFMALLAALSLFFHITDSFRTASGELYYGVATVHGIRAFSRRQPLEQSDFKLRWGDLFRVLLSLIVFLAFALLNRNVVSCYHVVLSREFINWGLLVVWFVVSLLFVLFPSERRGIGYSLSCV